MYYKPCHIQEQSIQHNRLTYLYFTEVATSISISTGPIKTGRHQGQNITLKKEP